MTCHRVGVAILCRRGGRVAKCSVGGCGRAHTRLCDFPDAAATCNLKLCDRHAARVGDRDLCPFHSRQLPLGFGGEP